MNRPEERPDRLWPELLAAYADGELDGPLREWVEEKLRVDPHAARELETQVCLSRENRRFWCAVEPPPPDAATWNRVFDRIEAGMQPTPTHPLTGLNRWTWALAGVIGTAAAVLIALSFLPDQPPRPEPSPIVKLQAPVTAPGPRTPEVTNLPEEFEVAQAEDVEIVRLPEVAADLLLIGEHPVAEPMVWASYEDVLLEWVEPDDQGFYPDMQALAEPGTPMWMDFSRSEP